MKVSVKGHPDTHLIDQEFSFLKSRQNCGETLYKIAKAIL
jgi:hypothetical protein